MQEKIAGARDAGTLVVFTRDTHRENYRETQEGRNLPVLHCLLGTEGWGIDPSLNVDGSPVFDKPGFGSTELVKFLTMLPKLESVELVGLCTDICVICNAMLASILQTAGYTTGLYTSPFISRFHERMQVNGVSISDEELATITEAVEPLAESMGGWTNEESGGQCWPPECLNYLRRPSLATTAR